MRTSKFRHIVVADAKREQWYEDLDATADACGAEGNPIAASAHFLAVPCTLGGGSAVTVVPVSVPGKDRSKVVQIRGHSAPVTALAFDAFDNACLASGSRDGIVKFWGLGGGGDGGSGASTLLPTATLAVPGCADAVTVLAGHVAASGLWAVGYQGAVRLWDASSSAVLNTVECGAGVKVQGIAWSFDGRTVAVTASDHSLRVVDARTSAVVGSVESHKGARPQRVVATADGFITAGFDSGTSRSIAVWDPRALGAPVSRIAGGQSTGSLLPLFDADTNVLLLPARGETTTRYFELASGTLHLLGSCNGTEQTKGACLLPKAGVDVMGCEIDRVFRLTERGIVPMRVEVPRSDKSTFDKIADIFPVTASGSPAVCTAGEWFAGCEALPVKHSLDPYTAGGASGWCASTVVTAPSPAAAVPWASSPSLAVASAAAASRPPSLSVGWNAAPKPSTASPTTTATAAAAAARPASLSSLWGSSTGTTPPPASNSKPSTSSPLAPSSGASPVVWGTAVTTTSGKSTPVAAPAPAPAPAPIAAPPATAVPPKQGSGRFAFGGWAATAGSPTAIAGATPPVPVSSSPSPTVAGGAGGAGGGDDTPTASSRPSSGVFTPLASSALKHIHADIPSQARTYFGLSPDTTDPVPFVCSSTHFALPVTGSGGPFLVWPLSALGKLPITPPVYAGHKASVTALAFCPSAENIIVSGSGDSKLKVWDIEKQPADACRATLSEHTHPITNVTFHPYVEGLFASASVDNSVRLWDTFAAVCCQTLTPHDTEAAVDLSFDLNGGSIAASFRDAAVRVLDPRAGVGIPCVTASWQPHADNRPPRAIFLGTSPYILTSGASKARKREIKIWDSRKLASDDCTPVLFEEFDSSPALYNPVYDPDTGLLMLWARGETQIRAYDVGAFWQPWSCGDDGSNKLPTLLPCSTCKGFSSPSVGLTTLPKRTVNVREVEVARVLRLSASTIDPLSFTVARSAALKPYFQDDLFVPAVTGDAAATIDEFMGEQKTTLPPRVSLQPADMTPLSAKPPDADDSASKKSAAVLAAVKRQQQSEQDKVSFMDRVANVAFAVGGDDDSSSDSDGWSD